MLEVTVAQVFNVGVQSLGEFVAQFGRGHQLTGSGQRGEPHRQVDVLAVNIVVIGDKRCNVGTCAQVQLLLRGYTLVGLVGKQVRGKCGFHAVLRAGKFDHQTVAQAFDQPPTVKGKELLLHMRHQFLPPPYEPICVLLHEPDGFHDVQDQ